MPPSPFDLSEYNSAVFPPHSSSSSSSRPFHLQSHVNPSSTDRRSLDDDSELGNPGSSGPSGSEVLGSGVERAQKRRKIRRSKQACDHCRVRKRKCGGCPPDPCPNCVEDEHECSWALEDGRSSSSRRLRGKVRMDDSVQGQPPVERSNAANGGVLMSQDDGWSSFFGDLTYNTDLLPLNTSTSAVETVVDPSQVNIFELNDLDFLSASAMFPSTTQPLDGSSQTLNPIGTVSPSNLASQLASLLPNWSMEMDPHQFVHAFSSRMPTVEQSSIQEETSPNSDFGLSTSESRGPSGARRKAAVNSQRMVKVTWWRPHGQTAIAPGLKRMTLKVRLADSTSSDRAESRSPLTEAFLGNAHVELLGPDRAPSPPIMKHLLDIFGEYFGSQFPSLDLPRLQRELEEGRGSVFLLNSLAAVAARFSTLPAIAQPDLQPHEYGNIFYKVAKDMLGSMLALPSRETVVALVLLCHVGFSNDSEAEEWMFAGMAVRMAIDLGLHLDPVEQQDITYEDKRLNRLVFWTVVLLDFALAFGTGRQPTFRVDEISQTLPTDEDVRPRISSNVNTPPHPFPYAVRQMYSYGHLIELLNSRKLFIDHPDRNPQQEVQRYRMNAMKAYRQLPGDLHWNVSNLQRHADSKQAPMYLQLHLWMHTIITSGYLTGTDYLRRDHAHWVPSSGTASGAVTPNGLAAAGIWRHSARTIGDILVLCDIVCPKAYLGLPFVNQAFYVAGSCYVKELEGERRKRLAKVHAAIPSFDEATPTTNPNDVETENDVNANSAEFFEAILTSVSTENISTLRKGLTKQTKYWSGVAWVAEALEQRIRGIGVSEIDLVSVTEKLDSFASVPDAGLLHRSEGQGV